MYIKFKGWMGVLAVMSLATLSSCSNEEDLLNRAGGAPQELVLSVSLPGGADASTRAVTNSLNDHWSYTKFEAGDQLGFFSQGGNYNINAGEGPINNALMTCEGKEDGNGYYRFHTNDVQIVQRYLKSSSVFFYFPYDAGISDNPGMELRRTGTDINDQTTLRCVDLLSGTSLNVADLDKGVLSGTFEHTFSELIIMRGEGFDTPPEDHDEIKVVMKKPYTHVTATPNGGGETWSVKLKLIDNSAADPLTDSREWMAWQGEDYRDTNWEKGKKAWYVVIPTLPGAPTEIDYIELYDNDGNMQRVTSMSLMNNSRYVESGWRYPIEIAMNELVPTVFPYGIIKWSENIDLTYERKRGISSLSDFQAWATAYNVYVESNADMESTLLKYGDKVVNKDHEFLYWRFYILSDINLKGASYASGQPIIKKLQDEIVGSSSKFAGDGLSFINVRLSNLPGPLFGELGTNGGFENVNIITTNIDAHSTTSPMGVIANTMTGGKIINCNVLNGTLKSKGQVGMAIGDATGGKITGCSFSGLLIGKSSYQGNLYITGNDPAEVEMLDNTSTVVFNQNND